MVVFKADSSSQGVGVFASGSQNAMMSSSISINDSELSSMQEALSDVVSSSSSSKEPMAWILSKIDNF